MECSAGYSSPRNYESFPAGLRVLVVDDDPTWLKILEKMLKKCSYEVITCGLAREALDLLRERKDGFDIVISDVNMPDMDGFKLLEHVGLEMDLPVIMMSVDGETSRVMKGVQHGACDYLLKPIRMKELRNIWQHVLRKRIHEVRDIEGHDGVEEINFLRNYGSENPMEDGVNFPYANDLNTSSGKKRKDFDNYNDPSSSSSSKKIRVVWTVDLHQKFVKAVNHIGFERVGPKKILDLMCVPWLTRENVASHLQKYRLYLSRLQKEKDRSAPSNGMNLSSSKEQQNANHCPQKTIITTNQHQQKDFTNGNNNNNNKCSNIMHNNVDHSDEIKSSSVPKAGIDQEPRNKASNADTISKLISWDGGERDYRQQQHEFEHGSFDLLSIPNGNNSRIESKCSGISRDIEEEEEEEDDRIYSSQNVDSRDHGIGQILHPKKNHRQTNVQSSNSEPSIQWSIKNQTLDQIPTTHEDSDQQIVNPAITGLTGFGFWNESPQDFLIQSDFHEPIGLGLESLEYMNPDQIRSEVAAGCYSYDSLKYDYDYPLDQIEWSVVNHGLFIV